MLPEDFIKRLDSQKYINKEALLKAMEEPSPVSIRTNPAKWNKKPVDSEPVEWCGNGYYLSSRPSYTLDPLYHSGCYYPQEASSMFLEHVFRQVCDSSVGLKVLDLCGAPGGKSTHLSNLIGDSGLLVANEVIRSRAQILAETLTKWGKGNFLVTQNDPSQFSALKGYFDVIVVDAPCSGEGMFRTDVAVSEWSVQNASHCSERQKRIVMDVWPALREGGILIYSTCTFNPEENEENVKWLNGRSNAESIQIDISLYKGVNEIDFNGVSGYGFYPDRIKGEGFFISAVRKLDGEESKAPRVQRFQELKPSKSETDIAVRWSHFSGERLLRRGDEIFALPCSIENYLQLFHSLTIIRPGTKLFTVKNNDSIPSHELAISVNIREGVFPENEADLNNSLAYLKRDNLIMKPENRGWNLLIFSGINLGFINNIGNRINNYFPVEWRIRMDLPRAGNENLIKWEMYGNGNS